MTTAAALPSPRRRASPRSTSTPRGGAPVEDARVLDRPGRFEGLIPAWRPRGELVPRWEQSFPAFLRHLKLAVRPGTFRTYLEVLARFVREAGDPLEASREEVEAFLARDRRGRHGREAARAHAAATVVTERAALRRYYAWARRERLVAEEPTEGVGAPRVRPYRDIRALSAEEARHLLEAIPLCATLPQGAVPALRLRTLCLWWLVTGRRHREVLSLRWEDVDLEVGSYVYEGKGGKGERRDLPTELAQATWAWARATQAERLPQQPLFPGRWSDRPVSPHLIRSQLRQVARRAGLGELPRPVHTLRHTSARLRRSLGASLEDIQAALDHTSLATTSLYLRRLEGIRDPYGTQLASLLSAPPSASAPGGA